MFLFSSNSLMLDEFVDLIFTKDFIPFQTVADLYSYSFQSRQ